MKTKSTSFLSQFAVAFLLVAFGTFAEAQEFAAEVGFRQQSGDAAVGQSTKSEVGYQLGVTGAFEISGPLYFRTGLLYTQRPLTVTVDGSTTSEAKISMTYFDVPATLMYKFSEYGGVYAGLLVSANLDKTLDGKGTLAGTKVTDSKSMITPFILGAAFKFAPQLGANVYFESAGDVASGQKNYRAVGVNLMFNFD